MRLRSFHTMYITLRLSFGTEKNYLLWICTKFICIEFLFARYLDFSWCSSCWISSSFGCRNSWHSSSWIINWYASTFCLKEYRVWWTGNLFTFATFSGFSVFVTFTLSIRHTAIFTFKLKIETVFFLLFKALQNNKLKTAKGRLSRNWRKNKLQSNFINGMTLKFPNI